ncbi:beta-lactamase/transpeptidase-like protein [Xylaria flabelliformis]|nr:beta-lactamase/transpeptidase-like protein [Xylaria flabelliformis]
MDKELNEILQSHVVTSSEAEARKKLLAASFVVVDKDGILYTGAAGRLNFELSSPAYRLDSISWLTSMTKLATAVSLLQLVERGVIALDDDVSSILPDLAALPVLRGFEDDGKPILEVHGRAITLRHLLSHTLGIGVDMADPDLIRWSQATGRSMNYMSYTLDGIKTPLKFAPGEGWYYGTAYDWAGQLLTKLMGSSLSSYMRDNIFEPLGMTSTGFQVDAIPDSANRRLAFAISEDDILKPGPSPFATTKDEIEAGGSGLFSTPADYARLLQGVLANKVLKPETKDLLFAPQLNDAQRKILMAIAAYARDSGFAPELPPDCPLDHGLGGLLNMRDVPNKRRAGSLMWSGATNGRWWIDRTTGVAGAMFTQVEPHGNPVVIRMYDQLERTVYQGLGERKT